MEDIAIESRAEGRGGKEEVRYILLLEHGHKEQGALHLWGWSDICWKKVVVGGRKYVYLFVRRFMVTYKLPVAQQWLKEKGVRLGV